MGLDTSRNCFHGAYSRFNRFRYSLGRQIGIELDEYIGYGEKGTKWLESIEHDIQPLLNHSDCDGKLTVQEAKQIANGLNSILDNFNDKIEADYDFKEQIIQFRDGCLDAISRNEEIDFH
jgi:hypothetical protein